MKIILVIWTLAIANTTLADTLALQNCILEKSNSNLEKVIQEVEKIWKQANAIEDHGKKSYLYQLSSSISFEAIKEEAMYMELKNRSHKGADLKATLKELYPKYFAECGNN